MSRRLIVRPEAEAEIEVAFDWYEECATGLGTEFLLCLDSVFNAIVLHPQQYSCVHRIIRRALTRRFPYEVFFVEEEKTIVVLSVFHAKRNPINWQNCKL